MLWGSNFVANIQQWHPRAMPRKELLIGSFNLQFSSFAYLRHVEQMSLLTLVYPWFCRLLTKTSSIASSKTSIRLLKMQKYCKGCSFETFFQNYWKFLRRSSRTLTIMHIVIFNDNT